MNILIFIKIKFLKFDAWNPKKYKKRVCFNAVPDPKNKYDDLIVFYLQYYYYYHYLAENVLDVSWVFKMALMHI
jgi:hypothetical protein